MTRPCPWCSESIEVEAIRCRHCGESPGAQATRDVQPDPGLSNRTIALLAGVSFVLPVVNAFAASVAWLALRTDHPAKARYLLSMGWSILGIQFSLWIGYLTIRVLLVLL